MCYNFFLISCIFSVFLTQIWRCRCDSFGLFEFCEHLSYLEYLKNCSPFVFVLVKVEKLIEFLFFCLNYF